jgi:hypothetical protein
MIDYKALESYALLPEGYRRAVVAFIAEVERLYGRHSGELWIDTARLYPYVLLTHGVRCCSFSIDEHTGKLMVQYFHSLETEDRRYVKSELHAVKPETIVQVLKHGRVEDADSDTAI